MEMLAVFYNNFVKKLEDSVRFWSYIDEFLHELGTEILKKFSDKRFLNVPQWNKLRKQRTD